MAQELTIQEYFNELKKSQGDLTDKRYAYAKEYFRSLDLKVSFRDFVFDYCANFNVKLCDALDKFANFRLSQLAEEDICEFSAEKGVHVREAVLDDDRDAARNVRWLYSAVNELKETLDISLVLQTEKPLSIGLQSINPFSEISTDNAVDADQLSDDEWQKMKDKEGVDEAKIKGLLDASEEDPSEYRLRTMEESMHEETEAYCGLGVPLRNIWRPGENGSETMINPYYSDNHNFHD
jgi:hypothetical protein